MDLLLTGYVDKRMKNDVGQVAKFSINGKQTGLVLQHVVHTTVLGGKKMKRNFTEAWIVVNGKIFI